MPLTTPACMAIIAIGAAPCTLLALYRWHRMRAYRKGLRP